MIKINSIDPIDRTSKYRKIEDLEKDFIKKFQSNTQPEILLKNFISTKKSRKYKAKTKEIEVLKYLKKNFSKILIKKPNELYAITKMFNRKGWESLIFLKGKTTAFGYELLYIYGYTERFRSQINRGIWLAKQINIKTCPYCNAQSTLVVSDLKSKSIAKFQFDHFLSKDQFPYLSISLYNLIPACANCNITKSNKSLNLIEHYHPYYLDLSIYFKFKLKYNPNPKKLNLSQVKNQNFEIMISPKFLDPNGLVKKHDELYHLNGVYNRHQDIAEDLLVKAIIYTQHLISSHLKIKGLFPDKSSYLKYLIGNYSANNELHKRPLAKFTSDIAKQLGLY